MERAFDEEKVLGKHTYLYLNTYTDEKYVIKRYP